MEQGEGDSVVAVFSLASEAVRAGVRPGTDGPLLVQAGITGPPAMQIFEVHNYCTPALAVTAPSSPCQSTFRGPAGPGAFGRIAAFRRAVTARLGPTRESG